MTAVHLAQLSVITQLHLLQWGMISSWFIQTQARHLKYEDLQMDSRMSVWLCQRTCWNHTSVIELQAGTEPRLSRVGVNNIQSTNTN